MWLWPILLMAVLTPITPYLDMAIARYFYANSTDPVSHFMTDPIFEYLNSYPLIPGQILLILSAVVLLFSYLFSSFRFWREPAMVVFFTIAIGAGLIVHVFLKDQWGRPRPRQVEEFGGQQAFRPYYKPNFFNQPEPSKSFPCGHCTMGFCFFAVALLGVRYRKKWLAYSAFALAIVLGAALGLARMALGAHFFSDVLMSALLMWLTALAFDTTMYGQNDRAH